MTLVCTEKGKTSVEYQLEGMPENSLCQFLPLVFFLYVQSPQVVNVNV